MTELFEYIKKINLKIKFLSTDIFAGEYISAFKGRGLEFEEVREYSPGDDIKTIDWNTSARTGKLHTKIFKEERELTVVIIVDVSGSMYFGSRWRFKSEIAAEISGLLAYTALRSNDKVSLILFDEAVRKFIPPRKGKNHIWNILRNIIYIENSGKRTNVNNALKFLANTVKKRSIVFFISDFLTEDLSFLKTMKILKKRFDFVPFIVSDKLERNFSTGRFFHLKGSETNFFLKTRPDYKIDFLKMLDNRFKTIDIKPVNIYTDKPYIHEIVKYFKEKRG